MEMIIDLEPISIAGLDCSIACMLTLANWQIKEYQLAFWSSWEFNYDREFSLFGERLDISMSTVLYNLKTNYFCEELELQIGTNITENIRKAFKIICRLLLRWIRTIAHGQIIIKKNMLIML